MLFGCVRFDTFRCSSGLSNFPGALANRFRLRGCSSLCLPSDNAKYSVIDLTLNSVVKVFCGSTKSSVLQPWQKRLPEQSSGSGFVIAKNRILTNAHVVADHKFLQVRKHGSPTKFKAKVEAVGHECDLAILVINNKKFWEDMKPLDLGDIPSLYETVYVAGYPKGGDNISITKGVVSRVELTKYDHSKAKIMTIQIDAAINPGNSGGPVVMGNTVVGVAFQGFSSLENTGYIIPTPVVKHFLVDGVSIGNDETVKFRKKERINYNHLVSMKKPAETTLLKVLREGKQHKFNINIKPVEPLIPVYLYDKLPSYYILAGFVFVPLTKPYMDCAPICDCVLENMPKKAGEQIVVISQVLEDDINVGYSSFEDLQVKKVNGVQVENLKHLFQLIEGCCTEDLRLDLEKENVIILKHKAAKKATSKILKCYGIPSARSKDLRSPRTVVT
ncbi:hypothetical protein AALP_AA2G073000 [Arabis alpina]|uniref:Protease Do-like PDZ domain-containing protein n=1 Tax=Arabis alpina TaxID=50452 RepID=A0A087HFV2_ARAAL|nr:hypothetical protein AALP_AA2G073000 [Arabis alpina]